MRLTFVADFEKKWFWNILQYLAAKDIWKNIW
jgi:hypothetical protein